MRRARDEWGQAAARFELPASDVEWANAEEIGGGAFGKVVRVKRCTGSAAAGEAAAVTVAAKCFDVGQASATREAATRCCGARSKC